MRILKFKNPQVLLNPSERGNFKKLFLSLSYIRNGKRRFRIRAIHSILSSMDIHLDYQAVKKRVHRYCCCCKT